MEKQSTINMHNSGPRSVRSIGISQKSNAIDVQSTADAATIADSLQLDSSSSAGGDQLVGSGWLLPSTSQQATVLGHLLHIIRMWWREFTMQANPPHKDAARLRESCGLRKKQIVQLYRQFRLLVNDDEREYLTVRDLERHSSLLASNPLKKYTNRLLFWNQDRLKFPEYVENLSLVLTNCIGCPQLHLVKRMSEMCYFAGVTSPKDVAQMQKLLALFNCFDIKETGTLDTQCLCPLVHDLLRCDSDHSVSSLVPHSMISRMVNTAIADVHSRFPAACEEVCNNNDEMQHQSQTHLPADPSADRRSLDTVSSINAMQQLYFDGHRMLLTKELFIRDQEDLHLDQLMAMRL